MKKKICFIIYDMRIGGAENMVCKISNELSSEFEISILTLVDNNKYKDFLNNEITLISLNSKKISKSIIKLFFFLKESKYDIIISNVWPITIVSSFIGIFFKKIKTIIIEHSVLTDQFLYRKNFFTRCSMYLSVLIFYNLTNKIIAVSKVSKKSLIKLGVRKNKIKVIYNFVEEINDISGKNFFNNDDLNDIKKKNKNNKVINLLNIGIFKKIKNQLFLIEVAKILLHKYQFKFLLLIIGDGPLKDELNNKINTYNLTKHVKILSNNTNLKNTIINCDLFISSSLSESFGLSILEALNLNKKVIVSNIDSSKEIIDDKHIEFICNLDTNSYAKKIINLSKSKIKNIDKVYKIKFNKNISITKYKKVIYSIL